MTKLKVDKENTKRMVSKRSLARLIAVQTLYQYQYRGANDNILEITDEVVDNYAIDPNQEELKSYRKKVEINFLRNLVNGSVLVLPKLDEQIGSYLEKKHNFEDIEEVLLQILRLGTFELQFMKDNPAKVIINEYVDIANSFFGEKKINFVNAILDKAAKEIR